MSSQHKVTWIVYHNYKIRLHLWLFCLLQEVSSVKLKPCSSSSTGNCCWLILARSDSRASSSRRCSSTCCFCDWIQVGHLLIPSHWIAATSLSVSFCPHSSSILIHVDFQTIPAAQTDVEGHVCTLLSGHHPEQRTVGFTFSDENKISPWS